MGSIGKFPADSSTQPRTDGGHGRPGQSEEGSDEEDDDGVKPAQDSPHGRHEVHIPKTHGFAAKAQRPQNPHAPDQTATHNPPEQRATYGLNPARRSPIESGQGQPTHDHAQHDREQKQQLDAHFSACMWIVSEYLALGNKLFIVSETWPKDARNHQSH